MSALRDALGVAEIRRLQAAWFGSSSAEYGMVVAISVYAFAEGGAASVSLFGVLRMLPALVLTPVVTSLADRVARERLLRWSVGVRCVALALAAAAILTDGPLLLVLVLAGFESGFLGVYRPAQASLLPLLARTPEELAGANVVSSLVEGAAFFVGPAVVGLLLALRGPADAMVAMAGLMALSLLSLRPLRVGGQDPAPAMQGGRTRAVMADMIAGLSVYPATPGAKALLALAFTQSIARGLVTVLTVLLSEQVLGTGEAGVGWLTGSLGLGGLVGGLVALRLVRGRRLARCAAIGVAGWGLPLMALYAVHSVAVALVLFALVGLANAVLDASEFTALQRLLPTASIGRALGVLETVVLAGVGIGSAIAAFVLTALSVQEALLVTGAMLVAAASAGWRATAAADRDLALPRPEVALLRRLSIFAPLPLVTVEHLATRLHEASYDDGAAVLREGDPGHVFHVVIAGEALASVGGRALRSMGPGDGFGEIALLRDIPRTATVVARGPLRTLTLDRTEFLTALAVNAQSAAAADALASGRLQAGAWQPDPEVSGEPEVSQEPKVSEEPEVSEEGPVGRHDGPPA